MVQVEFRATNKQKDHMCQEKERKGLQIIRFLSFSLKLTKLEPSLPKGTGTSRGIQC